MKNIVLTCKSTAFLKTIYHFFLRSTIAFYKITQKALSNYASFYKTCNFFYGGTLKDLSTKIINCFLSEMSDDTDPDQANQIKSLLPCYQDQDRCW